MAVIAKQRYKLDIAPKGGWVIVYASQHDNGAREIEFEITNQGNAYSIPASINISVQGVKSNKGYFSHSCSYSGNIVKMALADDMTDVIGKAICVLKFTNSSNQKLATAKFILNVDSDSSSEGVIIDTEAEEIFNQMLNDIRAQAASISADIAELQSMVGSPLVASTASAMTDHNKIYVYTGSQSGYTNGNWYYWNGSAWTSGGVYNSTAINIDSVPTAGSPNVVQSGGVKSALDGLQAEIPTVDSTPTQGSNNAVSSGGVYSAIQTLGNEIDELSGEISDLEAEIPIVDSVPTQGSTNAVSSGGVYSAIEGRGGLSQEAKAAFLACFRNVAWIDEHGQGYYDALESALYADQYPKITAIFNSGMNNIYIDDDINSLKQYLTVKYFVDSSSAGQVISDNDYTLTGTLTEGMSTMFVSYNNLTTVFVINDVVDFYNKWNWSLVNGDYSIYKGTPSFLSGSQTDGILFDNKLDYSQKYRRSAYVNRGKLQCEEFISIPDVLYPIPIPNGAVKATVSINPSTMQVLLQRWKLQGSVYKLDGMNSWGATPSVITFTASDDTFLCINIRYNSSNAEFASEPQGLTLTFE